MIVKDTLMPKIEHFAFRHIGGYTSSVNIIDDCKPLVMPGIGVNSEGVIADKEIAIGTGKPLHLASNIDISAPATVIGGLDVDTVSRSKRNA